MRKYELMVIFDNEVDTLENNKNFITTTLSASNINISEEKDLGQKRLAYLIKEKRNGHYFLYTFDTTQNDFSEIEKTFKLQKSILKYLILRQN